MNVNKIDNRTKIAFKSLPFIKEDSDELQKAFQDRQVMAFDIDTQRDFMLKQPPRKGLYVKGADNVNGAEGIIGNLKSIKNYVMALFMPVVETMDTHKTDDFEFTYFDSYSDGHCVKGTDGWQKIPETTYETPTRHKVDVSLFENDAPPRDFLRKMVSEGGVLTVEKNTYSIFDHVQYQGTRDNFKQILVDNPKFKSAMVNLKELGIKIAVVYGVATDYCVQAAVLGLKKFGIKPIVVQDAIKEVERNGLVDVADPIFRDVVVMSTKQFEKETNIFKQAGSMIGKIK